MLTCTRKTAAKAVSVARGLTAEATCTAATAARWAAGFGGAHVTTPAAGPVPASTPVMLVHGLGANKSYFVHLEEALTRAGYTVFCVNYRWVAADVAHCGTQVADDALAFLDATGADRLHVIAHSLGGVVVRWALAHTDLAARVGSVVTLGSPHAGTPLARLAPAGLPMMGTLLAQLRPEVASMLVAPDEGPAVPTLAVAGALDWVVPARSARLPEAPGVTNVVVPGTGHIAMATHPVVLAEILGFLGGSERASVHTAA